jgi:hypothetical protein
MILQSNGISVQLHGLQPSVSAFSLIKVQLLSDVDLEPADSQQLVQITQLLYSYNELFQEPTDLPPSRACGNTIPLILGA